MQQMATEKTKCLNCYNGFVIAKLLIICFITKLIHLCKVGYVGFVGITDV